MASNCTARPSACVGSGTSRTPRKMRRSGSTVRSIRERSTPARSTHTRMHLSQRYALMAGSHVCEPTREKCRRPSSELASWSMPCIQRNLMLRVGSIGKQTSASRASFSTRAVSEARARILQQARRSGKTTRLFYWNFLPSGLRSGAFWQRQSQNAVFELGFRFCLVYFHRQRDGSFERAIAALHAILPFLVFLSLVFLLTPDSERPILYAHVNVLGFDAGNFGTNLYVFVGFGHVHLRRKPTPGLATRQRGLAPKIVKHTIDLLPQITERIAFALRRPTLVTFSPWNNRHNRLLSDLTPSSLFRTGNIDRVSSFRWKMALSEHVALANHVILSEAKR